MGLQAFVLDFSRALGPYRGVYRRSEIRGFLEELNATFESVRFEPRDFIDAGDYVVVPLTIHYRGPGRDQGQGRHDELVDVPRW